MKKHLRTWLLFLLSLPAEACITPSTTTFFNVAASSFTVRWNTACSTGTVYSAQASREPNFSFPLLPSGAILSTGTFFTGLQAGAAYYVRASSEPTMAAAVVLGSTTTAFAAAGSSQTATGGSASVTAPPGAFSTAFALFISTDPASNPVGPVNLASALAEAETKTAANTNDPRRRPVPGSRVEVRAKNAGGTVLVPAQPLTITLSYAQSGGYVQGVSPLLRADTLSVYGLDEATRQWVRLASTVDTALQRVTALSGGYAAFALAGRTDTALDGVFAYPQPFTPGGAPLTFAEISQDAVIRLYTATGVLIKTLREEDGDSRLLWDGREESGDAVAAGVYYYVISSASEKRRGKIMVIR